MTGRTPLPAPATSRSDTEASLRHLRDTGVITAAEYDELMARSSV